MSSDLVDFIRARLDEDEQVARAAHYEGQRWLSEEEDVCRWPDDELVHVADRKRDARHIAQWEPARVLRDVEAKRRVVEALGIAERNVDEVRRTAADYGFVRVAESARDALLYAVRLLASAHAGHPDYRAEWALTKEAHRP